MFRFAILITCFCLVLVMPDEDHTSPRDAVAQPLLSDEPNIRPKRGDVANVGGKQLTWKEIDTGFQRILFFPAPNGPDNLRGTSYAVSYLDCEHAHEEVLLHLGMSHYGKVFLNGEEIAKRDDGPRGTLYALGDPLDVTLQKGVNVIVAKVTSASYNRWYSGLKIHLTDKDGNALEGIRVTYSPPDTEP